ncbi:MAG: 1,4-alpha-glucan branching enzyme, partial [Chloroflexota bacterium]
MDDPSRFPPLLGDLDLHLLGEGTQSRAYDFLGAHLRTVDGVDGVHFAVWAPNARSVAVTGDFNRWDARSHPMRRRGPGGIWELFIPGIGVGERYKYHIRSALQEYQVDKADPYGFAAEVRPLTASIVADLSDYQWHDEAWLANRARSNNLTVPVAIYEVHLGSWRRAANGGFLTYRDLAHQLVAYVLDMGYTHIEL